MFYNICFYAKDTVFFFAVGLDLTPAIKLMGLSNKSLFSCPNYISVYSFTDRISTIISIFFFYVETGNVKPFMYKIEWTIYRKLCFCASKILICFN